MRIQLDLSEEKVRHLKALMSKCGLETYKDLINNAISIFEWALVQVEQGQAIASLNENEQNYRILMMPALQDAARLAHTDRSKNGTSPHVTGSAADSDRRPERRRAASLNRNKP